MAEIVKETPRGQELALKLAEIQAVVNFARQVVMSDETYGGDNSTEIIALRGYNVVVMLIDVMERLIPSLTVLATRGFFDDNPVELTTEVLKQLTKG